VTRFDYDPENLPECAAEPLSCIRGQENAQPVGSDRRCVSASGRYALEIGWSGALLWDNETHMLVTEFSLSDAYAVTFMYLSDDGRTALLGVDPKFGIPSSVIERPGSMRLFDTHTGRCVRTLLASGTEEVHSRTQKNHMFGSTKLTADRTGYFYPDYYKSNFWLRRPSMSASQPAWLLSRVQSYAGAQERQRIIQRCTSLAKEKLAQLEIGKALQAISQGYDAAAGHVPEELHKLNAAAGRYGRIQSIRGVSHENLTGAPPTASSTVKAAAPTIRFQNPESGDSRRYPMIEILDASKKKCLHRISFRDEIQVFPSVCFSPDLRHLYCLTSTISKNGSSSIHHRRQRRQNLRHGVQFFSAIGCGVSARRTIHRNRQRQGLFFYSVADGAKTAFHSIKDKDTGSGAI
jgi:hypothetical protein